MSSTVEQLQAKFNQFILEDAKFASGQLNSGGKARKLMTEIRVLMKSRRAEIKNEQLAKKAARKARRAARKSPSTNG
jgi:hypothetical protein